CCVLYAWQLFQTRGQFIVKRRQLGSGTDPRSRQPNLRRKQAVRLEPGIHLQEIQKRLTKQGGSNQQDEGESEFRNYQPLAEPAATTASGALGCVFFQHSADVGF